MSKICSDADYRKVCQIRLWRHYLMEAKRLCAMSSVIEEYYATDRRPKLRIVK